MRKKTYIVFFGNGKKNYTLFREALAGLHFNPLLKVAKTQSQLKEILHSSDNRIPDVVFLDLKTSESNKREALPEIMNSDKYKNLVAVIYKTCGSENYLEKAFVNGEDISIGKPYSLSVMRALLSQVLSLSN
jgi:DNA-binding NarL/FixJ family response regulator